MSLMKLRDLLPVVETAYLHIETKDSPALMILKDYLPEGLMDLEVVSIDSQGFLPRKEFEMAPDDQFVRALKISLGEKVEQDAEQPETEEVKTEEKAKTEDQTKTSGPNIAFDPQAFLQASAQAADMLGKMLPQDPEVLNSILSQFNPANLGDQAEFAEMFNSMIDNANLSNFSDFVDSLNDVSLSGLFHTDDSAASDSSSDSDDDDDYIILDDDDE